MVEIQMGKNRFVNDKVFYSDKLDFGVITIAATTRYGKSCIAKNIYTHLSEFRPIVIFDYRGEHGDSRYPNFLSNTNIKGIPDLYTIQDFAFKMSDFGSIYDWASFGFPDMASNLMSAMAKDLDAHGDDPERMKVFLDALPVSNNDVHSFFGQYPSARKYLTSPIQTVTKKSMCNRFIRIMDRFYNGEQRYVENFGKLLQRHNKLHINLNLTDLDVGIARANVGKILEQIHNYLENVRVKNKSNKWFLKPLFVVEEADKLVPDWKEDKIQPSSLKWLVEYGLKLQKYGASLMFITQDPSLMHGAITSITHKFILGQLPEDCKLDSHYKQKTRKLRWDHDHNYREFVQLRKGDYNYEVFIPDDIPCLG